MTSQAPQAYYQQPAISGFNLDKALETLVTLTERGQKSVYPGQHNRHHELRIRPLVAL